MKKNVEGQLRKLLEIVLAEAETNEVFALRLEQVLGAGPAPEATAEKRPAKKSGGGQRTARRRDPAVLDPIAVYMESPEKLTERLQALGEKELKDIIADYGLDPSKRSMKLKNLGRLIQVITEAAERRATKGDAFRELPGEGTAPEA